MPLPYAIAGALVAVMLAPAHARAEAAIPLEIRSREAGGILSTQIDGVVDEPFEIVSPVLGDPLHWCQFVPIDPTIRGCTWHAENDGAIAMTLYGGSENSLLPDTAFELPYRFASRGGEARVLEVSLAGDTGPMGSRDYRLTLRAEPADAGRTRVRVASRCVIGGTLDALTRGYLATAGRDKSGFTVVGRDPSGAPRYVGGVRGLIERGAMRHYLALAAYLDSLDVPAARRFEASIERWWTLSQGYPQLEEESRSAYLETQRREHARQRSAQARGGS